MAKPKVSNPVSSYGPDLFRILKEGANKRLELKFPTERAATQFTHRIHGLRAAMRREGYTDWEQYYRCGVYPHPSDRTMRIVQPRDSEFTEVLEAAGIPTGGPEPIKDTNKPTTKTGDPAEDFLADLRGPNLDDL